MVVGDAGGAEIDARVDRLETLERRVDGLYELLGGVIAGEDLDLVVKGARVDSWALGFEEEEIAAEIIADRIPRIGDLDTIEFEGDDVAEGVVEVERELCGKGVVRVAVLAIDADDLFYGLVEEGVEFVFDIGEVGG